MRKLASAFAGTAIALTLGCESPLDVENVNTPDVDRAFSTPAGVERIIGSTFQLIHIGNQGSLTSIQPGLFNMAFESYASVANAGMSTRAALPRLPVLNTRGNATANENFRDFAHLTRAARLAGNAVAALDTLVRRNRPLPSAEQTARARAFGFFTNGVALGNLALAYDSAAIMTPALPFPSDTVPPLMGYRDVMNAAIASLDSAVVQARAMGTQTLPSAWINGNALNRDNFIRLVRSYRARFRAGVARTPAERASANWDAIIADADSGITADVNLTLAPGSNWDHGWMIQHYIFLGWHQMTPMIIGMADTSGAYDAWLDLALSQRAPFLIHTPDKRFPAGATRTAQQAASPSVPAAQTVAPTGPFGFPYFRNRPSGDDTPGEAWGTSFYDFYRFRSTFNAARNGPWPLFTKAEVDMLSAEGNIRKGNFARAVTLINPYRVRAGLPALGAITSLTDVVPGGAGCVPRVPVGPSFTTTACGNIMEAMKWEKRLETAFTGWGQWYFDSRGWGDLAEGTALHYPVPFQEKDARGLPFRNVGGLGDPEGAAKGTYGF